jgi:hypothetical protein
MFFHVQEHRFTWLEVEKMIDRAGLKPVKILIHPDERGRYLAMFPDDPEATNLANWHRYEMQFPETFRNMYYLWLAHKADHETKDTAPAIWATSFL